MPCIVARTTTTNYYMSSVFFKHLGMLSWRCSALRTPVYSKRLKRIVSRIVELSRLSLSYY